MSDAAASAAAEAEAADKEETGSMHSSDEEILSNPDKFRDPTLNTLEEVADAVERAKTTVIQFDGPYEEKKVLVQRLINLRIQEYVMHERAAGPPIGFELKGHKFIGWQEGKGDFPGIGNTKKIYCQVCGSNIWVMLQTTSLFCKECGYGAHSDCVDKATRQCVAEKVRAKPDFIMEICPEVSMESLKFRCVECDVKLSRMHHYLDPRLCDYTGLWFCPSCHWNQKMITPARLVRNWQHEGSEVSQASFQYLTLMFRKPVINVEAINPKLFAVVPEMDAVRKGRRKVMLMKEYLAVCRIASDQKLLLKLASRQHFVDNTDYYSMQDLMEVKTGDLPRFMDDILETFESHIRTCVLCTAKGFICEICVDTKRPESKGSGGSDTPPPPPPPPPPASCDAAAAGGARSKSVTAAASAAVIFPFDEIVSTCADCKGVFHRQCFKPNAEDECPRCERRKKHRERKQSVVQEGVEVATEAILDEESG